MSDDGEGGFSGGETGGSDGSFSDSQNGAADSTVSVSDDTSESDLSNVTSKETTELNVESSTKTELGTSSVQYTELNEVSGKDTKNNTELTSLSPAETPKTELSKVSAKESELTDLSQKTENITKTETEKTPEILDIPEKVFETEPSSVYFYSSLGPGGYKIAAEYAKERGCTTLEMQLDAHNIKMPQWNDSEEAKDAWRNVSEQMAEHASGDVHVLTGDRMTADSVFVTKEYPALLANEKVDRIITVDPKTGAETVVMDRKDPANDKHLKVYDKLELSYSDSNSQSLITVTKEFVRFE